MSVKVRKYKRGGWEVDIRTRLADGTFIRERVRSWVETKNGTFLYARSLVAPQVLKFQDSIRWPRRFSGRNFSPSP